MKTWICALALAFMSTAAAASEAAPPTPLFAGDQPLRLTIRGPISALAARRSNGGPGTLSVAGTAEVLPIALSPRGITRRSADICPFPPLRVDFTQAPPAGSVFHRQRRL